MFIFTTYATPIFLYVKINVKKEIIYKINPCQTTKSAFRHYVVILVLGTIASSLQEQNQTEPISSVVLNIYHCVMIVRTRLLFLYHSLPPLFLARREALSLQS